MLFHRRCLLWVGSTVRYISFTIDYHSAAIFCLLFSDSLFIPIKFIMLICIYKALYRNRRLKYEGLDVGSSLKI